MASTKKLNEYSFCDEKFSSNEKIAEKLSKAGYDIFLPQKNQLVTAKETYENEIRQIRDCEFLIILLSDTRGIYLEAGYAKAIGKKIYAIRLPETRKMSEWANYWYDYIAENVEELIEYLKKNGN